MYQSNFEHASDIYKNQLRRYANVTHGNLNESHLYQHHHFFPMFKIPPWNLKSSHANTNKEKINKKPLTTSSLLTILEKYCECTSVHGLKYITKKESHPSERITWIILVLAALIGAVYVSLLLSKRFSSSPLATVVESTIYPVSEIPYPAVTICNYNRINWKRVHEVKKLYLPDADEVTLKTFQIFLASLEIIEFGSFEEFTTLQNRSLTALEHLNIFKVFEDMAHNCNEMFVGKCWWRNKYIECCELFVEQKTEYGLCYAFNSAVNDVGRKRLKNETNWPWRTSSYGDWSGLRFNVNATPDTRVPNSKNLAGYLISVHHPNQWPNSAQFIPSGTTTSIIIKPTYSYITSRMDRLKPSERGCVHDIDIDQHFMTLPDLEYFRPNCLSECRQRHTIMLCNCTVEFMFPIGNYTACNISGLWCLHKYDKILNNEKPPIENQYFKDEEDGIECKCLPECNRIDYGIEIEPNTLAKENKDLITLDIHFQYATMVKYRTDVVFGILDLIVAFGGIAGLFLGCSLLSGIEILYFVTFGVYINWRTQPRYSKQIPKVIPVTQLNTITKDKVSSKQTKNFFF